MDVMTPLTQTIRSRGYWRVVVRPSRFIERRVEDYTELYPTIQKTGVQLRGWDFPHVGRDPEVIRGLDWVGLDIDWSFIKEQWRFYQSGQFIHLAGFFEDWRDASHVETVPEDWKPGRELWIGYTLARLVEIFEFSARLSLSHAGDENMSLSISLHNLQGRGLITDSRHRFSVFGPPRTAISGFPWKGELTRTELCAAPVDLAMRLGREIFARFDWSANVEQLRDYVREFLYKK